MCLDGEAERSRALKYFLTAMRGLRTCGRDRADLLATCFAAAEGLQVQAIYFFNQGLRQGESEKDTEAE